MSENRGEMKHRYPQNPRALALGRFSLGSPLSRCCQTCVYACASAMAQLALLTSLGWFSTTTASRRLQHNQTAF